LSCKEPQFSLLILQQESGIVIAASEPAVPFDHCACLVSPMHSKAENDDSQLNVRKRKEPDMQSNACR
jgi:hypothetical protein